ncbi:threonine aspartase 1-like [Mya arenaria]|uniref:threonine aspartase 1-like n=1 Tax=Mya arenaria TaxID=6604 RepID=UPI0022DEF877|nr:threonine aspartase 1-like [Mya arenaria]
MENRAFIAVHAGAGYHSREKENSYRKLCSQTCTKVMMKLKSGMSALDAVTLAIQMLEDSPLTNAGRGSSLTLEGTVECDASVMDGKSLVYGAVGAISGVQNPVLVARKLAEEQSTGNMVLGRIPPW